MSVAYKSKDKAYMASLRNVVFQGMDGRTEKDKLYTWDFVRRQVVVDDLRSYAAAEIGKMVHFPEEGFNGELMIVLPNKPSEPELEIITAMTEKAGFKKHHLYITWLHKSEADTQHAKKVLSDVLSSEVSIIAPSLILSLGVNLSKTRHEVSDLRSSKLLTTYSLSGLFADVPQETVNERKRVIWSDFLQLIKHYKQID